MSSQADERDLHYEGPSDNPLIKSITCGSVCCSIFSNDRQRDGTVTAYLTVRVSRSYRDADGRWRYTNSFYKSHLPQLLHACQKALEFVEASDSSPF